MFIVISSGTVLQLVNGKTVLMYNKFTYYKLYDVAAGARWTCTHRRRCKAFLHLNDEHYFIKGDTDHSHPPPVYHRTSDGKYIKISA